MKLAIVAATCALTLVLGPPAMAGRVQSGADISYRAAAGERNDLSMRINASGVRVRDRAGITAGRGCKQVDATAAQCAEGFSAIVRLGDRNDRLRVGRHIDLIASGGDGNDGLVAGAVGSTLVGGRGRDVLVGGRGQDKLRGGSGPDRLAPGRGLDLVSGGGGGDAIRTRDRSVDRIRCGGGRDRVRVDRLDWMGLGCENVSRRSAAAVPLDARPQLTGGDFTPSFMHLPVGCPADGPATCVGAVSISRHGRRLARARFSIGRGHRRSVEVNEDRLPADVPVRFVVRSRDQRGRLVTRAIRGSIAPATPPPGTCCGGGGSG
jgi:hypothetical protein